MAIVKSNKFVEGFSGAIGSLVFKQLNGKTIICGKACRIKRKKLHDNEKQVPNSGMLRCLQVRHVKSRKERALSCLAIELHLPNVYTAAIKDYMRKADVKISKQ